MKKDHEHKTEKTIGETLTEVTRQLENAGIHNPENEAVLIVAHVLGENAGRVHALKVMEKTLSFEQTLRVEEIADQRQDRVPLQHLTGKAAFRNIELEVGPGVFIPRPETEIVTQFVIDELSALPKEEPLVVDLCAGSGAISLATVNEHSSVKVIAVEKETNAHAWAERNVRKLGDGRVTLIQADVTEPLPELKVLAGQVDVVVSNPPYVPSGAIPLDPEVRDHDPETALYSGEDGLDIIRSIAASMREVLRSGGLLVLEHAEHQGAAIRNILVNAGWKAAATHQDLSRRDRVTTARA